MVLKGFLSNLIELLFGNRSSPAKTVHNLRFKPLEYHLFAVLVHLPNRVNVRQQAIDGMVFQLVDLAVFWPVIVCQLVYPVGPDCPNFSRPRLSMGWWGYAKRK